MLDAVDNGDAGVAATPDFGTRFLVIGGLQPLRCHCRA
jgi:hypothetical protein